MFHVPAKGFCALAGAAIVIAASASKPMLWTRILNLRFISSMGPQAASLPSRNQ